jgi:hypothetical protein
LIRRVYTIDPSQAKLSVLNSGVRQARARETYTLSPEVLVSRFDFGYPRIAFPASPRGELNVDSPSIEFRLV